jgi:MFS family permease
MAVISSLLLMKLPPRPAPSASNDVIAGLKDSIVYIRNTPNIAMVLIMLALVSLLVLPFDTLLPVFAKVIYHGNAATFGYIFSFIGLGAVSGTFFLASLKPGTNLKLVLLVSTFLLGISIGIFSRINYFPLAMVFATLAGFGRMAQNTVCLTIIQVDSDVKMRGRVMGFMAMAMFGMLPLGGLLIGAVSEHIGAQNALLCQAVVAVIIAAAFANFLRRSNTEKATVTAQDAVEA